MRLVSKIGVAAAAAAAALAGPAVSASASAITPAPTTAAASCDWTAPLGIDTVGSVKFWLSYNSCTRKARGAIDLSSYPYTTYYWVVWVYNENTGDTQEGYPEAAGTSYSPAVDDAGTKSHACIQQYYDGSTVPYGPKSCTGYF